MSEKVRTRPETPRKDQAREPVEAPKKNVRLTVPSVKIGTKLPKFGR